MKLKYRYYQILWLFLLCFGIGSALNVAQAHRPNLDRLDTNTRIRTPITHGFWFPKTITAGEEWYRGRLIEQGSHTETGELPDDTDPDGHRGYTAVNEVRWLISHHWFAGDDENAEEQFYSRNPDWFFDPANPPNSIMGVFALFRWGLLDEIDARLAIHDMITSYTDREYTILRDGVWLQAMSNLSATDFTVNDGSRTVPNPLGLPVDQAIRNEIGVIMTHHFFGRNRNNTVRVMSKIYERLVDVLIQLNNDAITDDEARLAVARLVRGR